MFPQRNYFASAQREWAASELKLFRHFLYLHFSKMPCPKPNLDYLERSSNWRDPRTPKEWFQPKKWRERSRRAFSRDLWGRMKMMGNAQQAPLPLTSSDPWSTTHVLKMNPRRFPNRNLLHLFDIIRFLFSVFKKLRFVCKISSALFSSLI